MISTAVKITRKGQVTIPRRIREALGAGTVYFEVSDNVVMLRPVCDAAGSLSEYAKNVKRKTSLKRMKAEAWEEAVREKTAKKPS